MAESNVAQDLTNEVLNTISKSQAAVIDAIETWASAVQSIKPELPDVNLPFADKLPTPQEVVAGAPDLSQQLLGGAREVPPGPPQAAAPPRSAPPHHPQEAHQTPQYPLTSTPTPPADT